MYEKDREIAVKKNTTWTTTLIARIDSAASLLVAFACQTHEYFVFPCRLVPLATKLDLPTFEDQID